MTIEYFKEDMMFYLFQNRIKLLAIIVCFVSITSAGILVILSSPTNIVTAEPVAVLTAGPGAVTIDGYVDPSEWSSAGSHTSILQNTNPEISGTLYVMQDSSNLYLGFTIADDELTSITTPYYGLYGDTLQFRFDDNNSGLLFEVGENTVSIIPISPFVRDAYFVNITGSSALDTSDGGENNGIGMLARHADLNHFELSFPICSGDAHDFCLGTNSLFGVNLGYIDMYPITDGVDYKEYGFPYGSFTSLLQIQLIEVSQIYLPLVQR